MHGDALLPVVQSMREDAPRMTFVVDSDHASSTYAICYWLGAAGITPVWGDSPASPAHAHLERARVEVTTVPVSLGSFHGRAGCRDGNSSGVPLIRDYDVVRDLPTAVLAASRSWAGENRATLVSTLAALVEASNWLDASMESRREASGEFEAMFPGVSSNVLMDSSASAIIFGRNASAAPNRSHALWLLTQMIRWGHLPSSLGDAELVEMAESAFRADVFREAVVASGSELSGMEARLEDDVLTYLIDGNHFRSQKPSAYAASFEISVR